jgi:hypothetical protein
MSRGLAIVLAGLVVMTAASCGKGPAGKSPPPLTAAENDSLLKQYAKDRSDTEDWLKSSPTSYLATVERRDFGGQTSMTVGSATDNDVRIDDPGVKPHHLRVTVVGDSFEVKAVDRGATFTAKDSVPSLRPCSRHPGSTWPASASGSRISGTRPSSSSIPRALGTPSTRA